MDIAVCQERNEVNEATQLTTETVETNIIANDVIAQDNDINGINQGFLQEFITEAAINERISENGAITEGILQNFKDIANATPANVIGNEIVAENFVDDNNLLPSLTTEKPNAVAPVGNEIVPEDPQLYIEGVQTDKTTKISNVFGNGFVSEGSNLVGSDLKSTETATTSSMTTRPIPTTKKKKVKDKWTVFAECCWELRLMYYWECDLYLKRCCLESNLTEYRPVCASTGPGYIYWWKPYRRVFYNDCAAVKYLCESLPPLTMPWKCMWRRDDGHPHCQGKKNGRH